MCGIAGIIGQQPLAPATLEAMLAALRRRGPDAEHVVGWNAQGQRNDSAPETALIHTRLAIMDPRPEADQPFSNDDGSVWLCYNGEVYDWQPHADALRQQGVQFKTHADTEFILRGYEAWGLEGLLPKLRGMFAFAILDWNKREVFLVRDRMGLKPLLYTTANGGLAFGSLVRSVLPAVPHDQRQFSPQSIDAYLAHRYIPAPRTIFQHIHRLENAHYLHYRINTQQLTKHCYWTAEPKSADWKTELDTAIRIRTVADRPLGVFLSGGIDSSTIACRLKEQGFDQLQTFSASFPGSSLDESSVAKSIAQALDLPNQEIPVPLTIANDFEQIIADLDEPFADPSSFPTWYLSQATTQHVKVVLGGDGGDELLAGYKRIGKHLRTTWRRLLRLPDFLPIPRLADKAGKGWRKLVEELRLNWLEAYSLRFSGMTPGQRAFLQPAFKTPQVTYWRYPAASTLNQLSPIKQLLAVDADNYLPEYILRKADLCTMAHGLELRAPLLDHRWAECVMALPDSIRFTQPAKKLFAEVTQPLAPLKLFDIKKRGFNPPLQPWLQEDLKHRFAGLGQRLEILTNGQVNAARTEALVTEYLQRPALAEQILQLLILDCTLGQLDQLRSRA
jgi:asparagine synthase (glutamine-hydrolysing)